MKIKRLIYITIVLIPILSIMSSCSTKTLYSWYDYEDVTYQYNKKRTEELKVSVLTEYLKVIEKQKGVRGIVPPGMYAEYGYMLYRTGKHKEGLEFLKQEINLYPESEKYIVFHPDMGFARYQLTPFLMDAILKRPV